MSFTKAKDVQAENGVENFEIISREKKYIRWDAHYVTLHLHYWAKGEAKGEEEDYLLIITLLKNMTQDEMKQDEPDWQINM